jgi:hypothetical protein
VDKQTLTEKIDENTNFLDTASNTPRLFAEKGSN